jgi:tetratricopeptide (TPR) repeat protein
LLARDEEELDLDLTRTVFLDTETTGLAGGSGTCAFLVGIGYFEDDTFRVRQLFMRDYAEEEAMLHELTELLSPFRSLVTFNGKSFDVPLLESRYILSRLRFPLSEIPHLDLLHPARNLWKARLDRCRLTDLENMLLGHEREDDVPGELIPSLYFDYIRSKDASHIFRVFTHNCHDILSLAVLTARAMEMLDESAPPEDPIDDYSLGRIFELASRPERSIKHYSRAIENGVGGAARRRALRGWAYQHKRRGEVMEAVELWRELTEEEGPEAIPAFEELAMVLEHREQDFSGALEHCERALSRIEEDLRLPLQFRERWFEAFQHRRRRLERKIGRRQK